MSKFTQEQQAVIDSSATTLAVNAFAGTGKTTTLIGFAKARPEKRILYLAFNKSVADEAKTRFPGNVVAKTSHSLAFGDYGKRFRDKLGNPKPYHVKKFLSPKLGRMRENAALVFSSIVLDNVQAFLGSGRAEMTLESLVMPKLHLEDVTPEKVLEAAQETWDAMQDVTSSTVPMPHDGYLKLYQLSNPNLCKYDYLLLDEAQDTNPCLFSIFEKQETGKVLVGDEHQNIYSFRGAMNAMAKLGGERHVLTSSFRFGEAVADVANGILSTFKNETTPLQGLGETSYIGKPMSGLSTAFLHRTNADLFDRAVGLLANNLKIHFVGGVQNYGFQSIKDAWHLMEEKHWEIEDPLIKSMKDFSALESYAETTDDRELIARARVVKKYAEKIPRLVERLTNAHTRTPEESHASLTSAHKSKGLEWEQVVIGSDFPQTMSDDGQPNVGKDGDTEKKITPDEANLLYVAVTRARKNLVLNEDLQKFVDKVCIKR